MGVINMKKTIILLIALILNTLMPSAFAENDITVYMNGEKMSFEQPPIIRDDSTLVPFRAIFESLDMTVQWFEAERRVTALKEDLAVSLIIDTPAMRVNDELKELLTPPIIYNDYTMVPLRAISEAAGAEVGWDGETRTVTITTKESDFESWAEEVFALTNAQRQKNGLKPLKWDKSLALLAEIHCEDMIERGFFDHVNPDGETPFDRMREYDIEYWTAGENIAAGQYSPKAVVEAWMNSETHRENILSPNFKSTGISVLKGGDYGIYWVQEFAQLK